MIVVDASVVVEHLTRGPLSDQVDAVLAVDGASLHSPQLVYVEVAQVMRRFVQAGRMDAWRGREAMEDLAQLDIASYADEAFLPRVWELRHNLTAYDATYVALAEALPARLVTLDRRLIRAAHEVAQCEIAVV